MASFMVVKVNKGIGHVAHIGDGTGQRIGLAVQADKMELVEVKMTLQSVGRFVHGGSVIEILIIDFGKCLIKTAILWLPVGCNQLIVCGFHHLISNHGFIYSGARMYIAFKHSHMMFAVISGLFFLVRGCWMLMDSGMLQKKWVKILPHVNDTLLLLCAIVLCVMSATSAEYLIDLAQSMEVEESDFHILTHDGRLTAEKLFFALPRVVEGSL